MPLFVSDAVAAEPSQTAATGTGALLPTDVSPDKAVMDNLVILGMLFFIFYFILIRPQQKRLKAHQSMLKDLAKGHKVVTSGGLIGTIVKFEGDDVVQMEIAQGVKVRVAKSAVTDMVDEKTAGAGANDN